LGVIGHFKLYASFSVEVSVFVSASVTWVLLCGLAYMILEWIFTSNMRNFRHLVCYGEMIFFYHVLFLLLFMMHTPKMISSSLQWPNDSYGIRWKLKLWHFILTTRMEICSIEASCFGSCVQWFNFTTTRSNEASCSAGYVQCFNYIIYVMKDFTFWLFWYSVTTLIRSFEFYVWQRRQLWMCGVLWPVASRG
jgi:hypothetical protein